MFWMRNKENNFPIRTLIWRPELAHIITVDIMANKKKICNYVMMQRESRGFFLIYHTFDTSTWHVNRRISQIVI